MPYPSWLYALGERFAVQGYPLYVVGGAVRNALLGLHFSDIDLSGPAHLESLQFLQDEKWGTRLIERAPEFGTVEIQCFDGQRWHSLEYTTFRKDSYREGHRPDAVHFTDSLAVDAARRDFSINAIYFDLQTRQWVDPLKGIEDLRKKCIRTTSADPMDILREDGLRLLRMVRFASQLEFTIDEGLWVTAQRMGSLLLDISNERIREEFSKILLSDVAYPELPGDVQRSVYQGMHNLHELGIMRYILPGWERIVLDNVNFMTHTRPQLHLRLAALLQNGRSRENVRSLLGENGLRYSRELTNRVSSLLDFSDVWKKNEQVPHLRRIFASAGEVQTHDLIAMRQAMDHMQGEHVAAQWEDVLECMKAEGVPFSTDQLAIDGREICQILGEPPSERIGAYKRWLWLHVIDHPADNNTASLIQLVREAQRRGSLLDEKIEPIPDKTK